MALRRILIVVVTAAFGVLNAAGVQAQARVMRPDDLFRYERIAGIVWSPDFARAAVEIHRPAPRVGVNVSSADLALVDAATGKLRVIASPTKDVFGFFSAAWSPDGRKLAFFSIDHEGRVRPWLWTIGAGTPAMLADLQMADGIADGPRATWIDANHLVLLLHDPARPTDGPLYFAATRGRNVADQWQTAVTGPKLRSPSLTRSPARARRADDSCGSSRSTSRHGRRRRWRRARSMRRGSPRTAGRCPIASRTRRSRRHRSRRTLVRRPGATLPTIV